MKSRSDAWAIARQIADGRGAVGPVTGSDTGLTKQLTIIAAAANPLRRSAPMAWGPLEVHELIGEGGYGRVYRARDPLLDRDVALKLLKDARRSPRNAEALIREARRLAQVRHPNVITIYGAERVGDEVGIWMELVDGTDLARLLDARERMPVEAVIAIGLALCDALEAVHAGGLTHGDVKPENVLVSRDGRIILTDFGAARGFAEDVHTLRATLQYIAPEIAAGAPPSVAGDIFSLGVVLRELAGGVPPGIAVALERSTAPDPQHRYRTVRELAQALQPQAVQPARADRSWRVAGLAARCAMAIVLLWGSVFGWYRAARPAASESAQVVRARPLYLQGRQAWNTRDREGLRRAMERFKAALAEDPEYADAWAGMAQTYVLDAAFGFMLPTEALPRASAAARRALEINPRLAEAHVALGYVEVQQGRIRAGEDLYRKALQLDPENPTAHHWYGLTRLPADPEEGLKHLRQAFELDPLSQPISTDLAIGLMRNGRLHEAIEQYRRAIDVFPDYLEARTQLAAALLERGDLDDARVQLEVVRGRDRDNVGAMNILIEVLRRAGNRAQLDGLHTEMQRTPGKYPPFVHTRLALARGDLKGAVPFVRMGLAARAPWIGELARVPPYDAIARLPEVREFLRGLQHHSEASPLPH